MSEKFWMTASRPLTSPPFGKLSGVSHSTSSAKDWATAPRSPRMKASYAVRTVWTFSADMVSLQWCLTGTPTLSDPFTTVKHGAQGQRAGDDFTRKHRQADVDRSAKAQVARAVQAWDNSGRRADPAEVGARVRRRPANTFGAVSLLSTETS